MCLRRDLVIVFLLFLAGDMQAQDPFHVNYGLNEGLPSEQVYNIHFDENNMLWATTDRGVFTFDGYEVESFGLEDGLAYSTNFKIIPDLEGALWFNGHDGSFSCYKDGEFSMVKLNHRLKNSNRQRHWFSDIAWDSTGQLFAHSVGIDMVDLDWPRAEDESDFPKYHELLSGDEYFKERTDYDMIAESKEQKYSLRAKVFENRSFFVCPEIRYFPRATCELENGAVLFEKKYLVDSEVYYQNGFISDLVLAKDGKLENVFECRMQIHAIYEDKAKNIFLCTNNGLFVWENGNFSSEPKVFFRNMAFTDLKQDLEGNYWGATLENGLIFMPSIRLNGHMNDVFFDQEIVRLSTDHSYLFLSGAQGLVYSVDSNLQHRLLPVSNGTRPKEFNENTWGVNLGSNHVLCQLNSKGEPFVVKGSQTAGIIGRKRANGDHVVLNNGLRVLRNDSMVYKCSAALECDFAIAESIIEDQKGDLWIGTLKGLYFVHQNQYDLLMRVVDEDKLLATRIKDIIEDSYGNRWLATIGAGLLYHKSDGSILQFGTDAQLSSDLINCVFLENDSVLWVGTNSGLDKVILRFDDSTPSVKRIYNLDVLDGIPSNFVSDITFWKDQIWVVTRNGLFSFEKGYKPRSIPAPKVLVGEVAVEGFDTEMYDGIDLKYDQRDITFRFKGVSYWKPKSSFYKYALTKDDKEVEWVFGNERLARFNNLDHGDYTFTLLARNKYDNWSEPFLYSFTINPHFSSTWWFRLMIISLGLLLFYWIYKLRMRYVMNVERQQQIIEESALKTKIAKLSTFRNQFNPHFVFNSINSIQHYIFNKDVKRANYFLGKFSKLIRQSLKITEKEYTTLEVEFDFIRRYVEIELLRFPDKFTFEILNVDELDLTAYLIPPLIIQPVVENVLKHAFVNRDDGSLEILVRYHAQTEQISIHVIDNGRGLIQAQQSRRNKGKSSFGLKIIKERIELLNINFPDRLSTFSVASRTETNGTIAKFLLPTIPIKLYDESNYYRR